MKKTVTLEQEDIDCLHDVILEAFDYSGDLTNDVVLTYWNMLPEHIKDEAEHWGLDDTVVRDNIYVWLQKHE